MTSRRSSPSIGTEPLIRPPRGHDGTAGEAAATTLLSAGVEGILGHASLDEWDRIQRVLRSVSGLVPQADIEDALKDDLSHPWDQAQYFVRDPGSAAADSVRLAIDALWSDTDEAVFLLHRGETLGATSSLGRALLELQDSFSPAHVRRVKDGDGVWVITDVLADTGQDSPERGRSGENDKTRDAERTALEDLNEAKVLAAHLLLTYFVQRTLGLASEASQTRETLEGAYLREEVP